MSSDEYYDKYWDRSSKGPGPDPALKNVIERLDELALEWYDPKGKTLDCGCGNGRLLEKISGAKFGVDVSNDIVKICKGKGIDAKVADLEGKLPFKDSEFSTVISLEVLEHLRDVDTIVSEINRVLKPNGKFLLSVPYHGFLKNLTLVFLNFDEHFNHGDHVRFFTVNFMKKLLLKHGFSIKRVYKIGRIPPLAYSMFFVCEKK